MNVLTCVASIFHCSFVKRTKKRTTNRNTKVRTRLLQRPCHISPARRRRKQEQTLFEDLRRRILNRNQIQKKYWLGPNQKRNLVNERGIQPQRKILVGKRRTYNLVKTRRDRGVPPTRKFRVGQYRGQHSSTKVTFDKPEALPSQEQLSQF